MLTIILTALDQPLYDAWQRHCSVFDFVQIERCSILDLEADALVSPANSFGFMDGGIDLSYSRAFGWAVQARLQARIQTDHGGELLVGQAECVPTGHPRLPNLIAAPTMRVPQALTNSVNPYLAARAVFRLIAEGLFKEGPEQGGYLRDRIRSVAFPGLGTGIGEVRPDNCARQMREAIRHTLVDPKPFPQSWVQAQEWHHDMVRP